METIKDRLSHIIRAKNLTATQFAEMMQIQPSNVSHLLSGRNKPSLDFLIKLKDVFPEYSFDWIILGKKPITVSERNTFVNDQNSNYSEEVKHKDVINDNSLNLFDFKHDVKTEDATNYQAIHKNNNKRVVQLIYVYEDHTFKIFDVSE